MLTCKDASHLISENQERLLSFRERWGLRMHLWMCVGCRRFQQQMVLLRRAMHKLAQRTGEDAAAADFPTAARERIRKALVERNGHD